MNIFIYEYFEKLYNTINFKYKNEFFLIDICHKLVTNWSQNSDRILNQSQICDEIFIPSQNSDRNTILSQFFDRFVTDL